MLSSQEALSASMFLEQIRKAPDRGNLSIPIVVNFSRTALATYLSLLRQLLIAKKPSMVILYKWPYTEVDQASLAVLYQLFIDVNAINIRLDLRHLSEDLINDIYVKTKAVLTEMPIKPLIRCDVMSTSVHYDWNRAFLELLLIPYNKPAAQPPRVLAPELLIRSQPAREVLQEVTVSESLTQSEPQSVRVVQQEEPAPLSPPIGMEPLEVPERAPSSLEGFTLFSEDTIEPPSAEDMLDYGPPPGFLTEVPIGQESGRRSYCQIM